MMRKLEMKLGGVINIDMMISKKQDSFFVLVS